MHDHIPFASTRSIADAATVAVPFKNCLAQPAEILGVLPLEVVATRTKTVGKDFLPPAWTMHRALDLSRHSPHIKFFGANDKISTPTSIPSTSTRDPSSHRTVNRPPRSNGSVATTRPGQGMSESLPCRRRQAGWRLQVGQISPLPLRQRYRRWLRWTQVNFSSEA